MTGTKFNVLAITLDVTQRLSLLFRQLSNWVKFFLNMEQYNSGKEGEIVTIFYIQSHTELT